jgi:phosphorylcholine metabolism protein LicD
MLVENCMFCVPEKPEEYLALEYGNYLELPPPGERVNHSFVLKN